MRRIGPLLLASLLFLGACKKNNSSTNPCKPESIESYFEVNKTIDATIRSNEAGMDPKPYDYQVKGGSNTVFTFKHRYMDCPEVMDDEGSRLVMIEIPSGSTSFSMVDNEVAGNVLMVNQCFCYEAYPHMITRGKVTGRKLGFNRWEIEASLYSSASQTTPVYFKRVFTLKN